MTLEEQQVIIENLLSEQKKLKEEMDESKKSTEKTSNLKPWENYLKEAKHYKTTTHQYKKLLADAYNSYAAYRQGDDWDAEFDDPNKLKDLRKKLKEELKSEKE